MTNVKQFDAVVIGSGLGGLTAGALLAKAGYSVCVLERNFSLGGAASVYRIGGLTVEASLHQTSDARNPRDVKHQILSELGILDEIEWLPTGPLGAMAAHHLILLGAKPRAPLGVGSRLGEGFVFHASAPEVSPRRSQRIIGARLSLGFIFVPRRGFRQGAGAAKQGWPRPLRCVERQDGQL